MQNPFKSRDAFTLVELLMVVVIIMVLASIALPAFLRHTLKGYQSEVDYDAKNIYMAAQNYLVDNPYDTVDSLAKLHSGGYLRSENVVFVNGSMTLSSGNIEIYSSALKTYSRDNNVVIYWNGRIERVNAP